MIEQQVRPWEVLDQRVLDALAQLPREQFVGPEFSELAYADAAIPLPNGGFITLPKVAGRMAQALQLAPTDKVLEIGTGSGYVTALLASLASHVYSLDLDAAQSDAARRTLAELSISNITLLAEDGSGGWPNQAPYDAIAITGSMPELADYWQQQLAIGGRLFAVIGNGPIMEAVLVTRVGRLEFSRSSLFETDLPALVGMEATAEFEF